MQSLHPHGSEEASYCIFVISKLRKRTQKRGSDKLTHLGAKPGGKLVFQIPQNARRFQSQPHRTCRPRRAEDGGLVRRAGLSGSLFCSILIFMALKNSKTGSLPVSEIYNFMTEHFPYFKVSLKPTLAPSPA
jgi:hypothetical protein